MSQPTPEQIELQRQRLAANSNIPEPPAPKQLTPPQPGEFMAKLEATALQQEQEQVQAVENIKTGESLDFDISSFIKEGIIVKTNIPLMPDKLYVDMQTLTQKQRLLCEQMVKEEYGNLPADNVYSTAIEAAMLAMSITRMNNQYFPIPDATTKTPENLTLLKKKKKLFDDFMKAPNDFIKALGLLYGNLSLAHLLTEGDKKKS